MDKRSGQDNPATVEFWYDFSSSYSYPAAMRIEALAAGRGVKLIWRPFLLGPLFAAQGMRDAPFNLFPVKGRYMWRDLQRVCDGLGLPLTKPEPFPQNGLLAARVALTLDEAARPAFTRAVYRAEFGESRAIGTPPVIAELLESVGVAAAPALARAVEPDNKDRLRSDTERAAALGLFGAPTLTTRDGELFWGNDRLEQGLDWALAHAGDVKGKSPG